MIRFCRDVEKIDDFFAVRFSIGPSGILLDVMKARVFENHSERKHNAKINEYKIN